MIGSQFLAIILDKACNNYSSHGFLAGTPLPAGRPDHCGHGGHAMTALFALSSVTCQTTAGQRTSHGELPPTPVGHTSIGSIEADGTGGPGWT